MFNWWESLSYASQIFALIAIPATLVLLIQTVLMLIGIGMESDGADGVPDVDAEVDADLDSDGIFDDVDPTGLDSLRIFTLRGIIAFLVVFGWTGLVMNNAGINLWIVLAVAFVAGFAMMTFIALLLRGIMKLRNDGNIDNKNACGVSGRVYLTVPPSRTGEGKVNILLQGSYVERDAVTDEEEAIPTGAEIVVIGISGQTTLVVRRK